MGPIHAASQADISSILAIQDEYWLLTKQTLGLPKETLEKHGFLVHKTTANEYEEWISADDAAVLVYKEGGELLGYAVGYPLSRLLARNPSWDESVTPRPEIDFGTIVKSNPLYFRQEAVALRARNRQLGQKLSVAMVGTAFERWGCTSILGEILVSPLLNRSSYPGPYPSPRQIGTISEDWEAMHLTWGLVHFTY